MKYHVEFIFSKNKEAVLDILIRTQLMVNMTGKR